MTKYKWSLLGLIISTILFIVFLISPLIDFVNVAIIPAEAIPIELISSSSGYVLLQYLETDRYTNPFIEISGAEKEQVKRNYKEWYENVPKTFNWHALNEFKKSFYHWNLFWISIIIFSVLTANYKKEP